jgi:hypothetical protein
MTRLLERALKKKAKTLPSHRQDEVGEMVLAIGEQDSSSLRLSKDQEDEVRRRMATTRALVPEAEMESFFRKHGK